MVIDILKNTTASLQTRVQILENKLQLLEEKMESQKQIEKASMENRLVNIIDKVSLASIPSYKAINRLSLYRD